MHLFVLLNNCISQYCLCIRKFQVEKRKEKTLLISEKKKNQVSIKTRVLVWIIACSISKAMRTKRLKMRI